MSIVSYASAHWVEWLGGALGGALLWWTVHWIAGPLLRFLSDRQNALLAVEQYGTVGYLAARGRIALAKEALAESASKLSVYAQSPPLAVRIYCRARRYDLRIAGGAMYGLCDLVGEGTVGEQQRRQIDAARVCLGATALMSSARILEIQALIREADIQKAGESAR